MLLDEGGLGGGVELLGADVEACRNVRQMATDGLQNGVDVPDEEARVPEELAAVHEDLRQLAVGLFGEGLDLDEVTLTFVAALDVAVARLGSGGFDAEGDQSAMLGHEVERLADVVEELVFLEDEVVRGGHDDVSLRAAGFDAVGGVGDAGRGVAPSGFGQDLVVGQEGQLLVHHPDVAPIGDNVDVFLGDDFRKAVDRHLQE